MLDNERCLSKKTSICSEAIIICTDISIVLCTKDSALKLLKLVPFYWIVFRSKTTSQTQLWQNLNSFELDRLNIEPLQTSNLFIGLKNQAPNPKYQNLTWTLQKFRGGFWQKIYKMTFLNNFFFAFSLFVTIFRALCIDYFVSKLTEYLEWK